MMWNSRTREIVRTLLFCLCASTFAAILKITYGQYTNTLAFIADGIHSLFDSTATILGIVSVALSGKPPDDDHPYGHRKFETLAAMVLALLLFLAAYEVGGMAIERFKNPMLVPKYSFIGGAILFVTMVINLGIARFEAKKAKELKSPFLASDSAHNQSDFLITCAVLVSLISAQFKFPYIDSIVSIVIACYLVYLSIRLIRFNLSPLVDSKILDSNEVIKVVEGVEGVLHCHAVRSRGHEEYHFLDLNIHLAGSITLDQAHRITHEVEDLLKETFPGLADVVIHTEPHNHPPCSKG